MCPFSQVFSLIFLACQGLDVPDIVYVIQYGVCRDMLNLQRGGRGGCTSSINALFLIMYKPWALTTDLSKLPVDLSDLDQPLQAITKVSKKPERSRMAMYQRIQSGSCIRAFSAGYLGDKTPTCMWWPASPLATSCAHPQQHRLWIAFVALTTLTLASISINSFQECSWWHKTSHSLNKSSTHPPQDRNIGQWKSANYWKHFYMHSVHVHTTLTDTKLFVTSHGYLLMLK